MKTNYFFFSIFCVIWGIQLRAQPTITSSDIVTGTFQFTEVSFNQGVYIPGNGGANITWDFSNIQGTTGGFKLLYGVCGPSISECNTFPTANRYVVSVDNSGNQSNDKNLFRVTNTQFEAIGARNNVTNFTLTYSDTPILLKFPTTYLQSFTDTSSYTANGVTTTTNDIITADGYGTVKTPVGTYTNVLRVKKESTVSISMNGSPVSTTQITTYTWYKNSREEIAGFAVTNIISPIQQASPSRFQYTNSNSSTLDTEEVSGIKSLAVYPNPVKDGKIRIDTKNNKIKWVGIYDMTGKKIFSQSADQVKRSEGKYSIDLQDYPSGDYIIKVETDKNIISNIIQIVHE
ncbi:T9SS type A sorting domain-containing protein [Chryseobacterium populi]|uniref:Por secretion system C-terminal sorting domain containing protein n=1 Tax=Chryseobacterium populi TaxID=1144316 RepID=J3CPS6_9FLAO|nr:T9SS type A sorting domain-containing protein [Chryseobacterium populi]EJL75811.1 Por secretion system C-terminal sorting domain containing protein [Chryseobacterium populi]